MQKLYFCLLRFFIPLVYIADTVVKTFPHPTPWPFCDYKTMIWFHLTHVRWILQSVRGYLYDIPRGQPRSCGSEHIYCRIKKVHV